jgi:hypothetical protein
MNPNLLNFLKTSAKILIAGCFLFVIFYVINNYTTIDLEKIGGYVLYGFFGITMAFMMVLIIGVMAKSLWISIMRRTGNIIFCCLDVNKAGVHIVGTHYVSGGDAGDGYYSYHHYFITLDDGRMFMSKKIKDEKDLNLSLEDLGRQTKLSLKPNLSAAIAVGGNTDDDVPTLRVMPVPGGELHIRGFENWFDEGFRIFLMESSRVKWKRHI